MHCNTLLSPSDSSSSDTQAARANAYVDQEQPPVGTGIWVTPYLGTHLAGKSTFNE